MILFDAPTEDPIRDIAEWVLIFLFGIEPKPEIESEAQ
jgi:hypothetical protein